MSFLMRGRPPWWLRDQTHPPASEPASEPIAQATGLPVAAPAPAGVTDDLSASTRLNRASAQRLEERIACVQGLGADPVGCETFTDGRPADRPWVDAELLRLEDLADLTGEHGPWEAAARMWAPVPKPTAASNAKYWATLRGQR